MAHSSERLDYYARKVLAPPTLLKTPGYTTHLRHRNAIPFLGGRPVTFASGRQRHADVVSEEVVQISVIRA
jgi:hypothetical protein